MPLAIILWALRSPLRLLNILFLYCRFLLSSAKVKRQGQEGLTVPLFLIISATARCNLSCAGCYSRFYSREGELSFKELDSLVRESKELGTFFYVMAGGEPLLKQGLSDLCRKHKDVVFLLFTNGMLIDESIAADFRKLNNAAVMLSIEGFQGETDDRRGKGVYRKILEAMCILRRQDVFFGFSATVSRSNFSAVAQDRFLDDMIGNGCRMGVFVDYIPAAGGEELALTDEERVFMRAKTLGWKKKKELLLFQLPEDEHELGGRCFSAGYGFLHITSKGYVEPCPFVHFATENIKDKPFREILRSPFLAELRKKESALAPGKLGCGLFENTAEVEKIASAFNAVNTVVRRTS